MLLFYYDPRWSLPAIFALPPVCTPHFGLLFFWHPAPVTLFCFFLEAWAQATGATLPVFMKSPECPDLGSPWPMTVWCRCMEAEHLWSELPCGIGEATLCGTWPELASWPDFLSSSPPASPTPSLVSLGAHFLCIFCSGILILESASGYPDSKQTGPLFYK